MKKRILSTFLLWTILTVTLYYGGLFATAAIITLFGLIAQKELYNMSNKIGWKAQPIIGLIIGACLPMATYFQSDLHTLTSGIIDQSTVLALGFAVAAILGIRDGQIKDNFQSIGGTFLGVLLIPYMLCFLIKIVQLFPGNEVTGLLVGCWVVVVAKFSDVGGLLFGSWFGKHKMAPDISPNKTWEGIIGGVFSSVVMGALFNWYFNDHFPAAFTPLVSILIAIPIAAMAAISDLIESVLKRQANVKDSGKTIPGIGGAFDLMDSLLLSAPVAFILISMFAI